MAQINPEDDFAGYMDNVQARQDSYDRQRALVEEHEHWRQNTWMGWVVRMLLSAGHHFAPFFESINDAFARVERESTASQIAITIAMRVLLVSGYVLVLYVITRLISSVTGRTIILEEEIVVEYEGDEPPNLTAEQIAKLKADATAAQKGQAPIQVTRKVRDKKGRGKKSKQS